MRSSHRSLLLSLPWLLMAASLQMAESGLQPASIKSKYGQLVTSSTLRWTKASSGMSPPPEEAVSSGTGNADKFVCRAEHHGALLVGQTTELGSYCMVGFVNKLYKYYIGIHGVNLSPRYNICIFTGSAISSSSSMLTDQRG